MPDFEHGSSFAVAVISEHISGLPCRADPCPVNFPVAGPAAKDIALFRAVVGARDRHEREAHHYFHVIPESMTFHYNPSAKRR